MEELSKFTKLKIKLESEYDIPWDTKIELIEKLINLEELEIIGRSSGLSFFIIKEFIELKKLKILNFNNIEICFVDKVDKEVLKYLDLKELSISTGYIDVIENIESLEILRLTSLWWRDKSPMPQQIDRLKNLKEFYFEGKYTRSIPDTIGNLKNLELLHLNCEQLEILPETIGNLKNLKVFRLDSIGYKYFEKLPENFYKLNNLEELILNCRSLLLSDEIGKLQYLKKLVLNLGEYYDNKLPNSICNLRNLKVLELQYETLLPENFGNLKELEKLVIKSSGKEEYELPDSIADIPNLTIEYDNEKFHKKFKEKKEWKKVKELDDIDAYISHYKKYRKHFDEICERIKRKSYMQYMKFKMGF